MLGITETLMTVQSLFKYGKLNEHSEAVFLAMSRSVLNEVGVTAQGWSCYATLS